MTKSSASPTLQGLRPHEDAAIRPHERPNGSVRKRTRPWCGVAVRWLNGIDVWGAIGVQRAQALAGQTSTVRSSRRQRLALCANVVTSAKMYRMSQRVEPLELRAPLETLATHCTWSCAALAACQLGRRVLADGH